MNGAQRERLEEIERKLVAIDERLEEVILLLKIHWPIANDALRIRGKREGK